MMGMMGKGECSSC
jgi:hypothetical protein